MSETLLVELFLEDTAHQQLLLPIVERVGREEEIDLRCRVRNARGGHAGAMGSFQRYQLLRERGVGGSEAPALLVVAIDGNCSSFTETSRAIKRATSEPLVHALVTACPDPHIERWYLADPKSFQVVVGTQPRVSPRKCAKGYYKQLLAAAVTNAGHPSTLGGIEFGKELADEMDLFRAGRNDSSLKAFISDLRQRLRRASHEGRASGR